MIYVFKTSVQTQLQVQKLSPHIRKMLTDEKWNFDLEDCDRILRVECEESSVNKIIDLLNVHQFTCEELE